MHALLLLCYFFVLGVFQPFVGILPLQQSVMEVSNKWVKIHCWANYPFRSLQLSQSNSVRLYNGALTYMIISECFIFFFFC